MERSKPYFAVIFTSVKKPGDEGYAQMAERMLKAVQQQEGYLGMLSGENAQGFRFTISYWDSLTAVERWKALPEHLSAQQQGRAQWYQWYRVEVCEVKKAYTYGSLPNAPSSA